MTALMRPNPVRARLQAGGTAYGTMAFEFFTPGLMAVLAEAGADFVLLDTEHSGVGIETIKMQIAASRGLGPPAAWQVNLNKRTPELERAHLAIRRPPAGRQSVRPAQLTLSDPLHGEQPIADRVLSAE
jgi:hypothetical protein